MPTPKKPDPCSPSPPKDGKLAEWPGGAIVFGMSMTVDQLVTEIRALPHDVMVEVVDRVLFESHGGQDPEHARAWSQTVHRRIEEIRSGDVKGIPGEETAAKIRRIVGR